MRKVAVLFIVLALLIACNSKKNRTIIFSGSSFTSEMKNYEGKWKFYLGYLIEISDTGGVKLMKRNGFMMPTNYYKISLPDSIVTQIFYLVDDSTIFNKPLKFGEDNGCVYDGPKYSLIMKRATETKIVTYIPCLGNQKQDSLRRIMDEIWKNSTIEKITTINLNTYYKIIYNDVLETFGSPSQEIRKKITYRVPKRLK